MDGELSQISNVARQTASLLASGDDDEKLGQIQVALQSAGDRRVKELDAQREVLRGLFTLHLDLPKDTLTGLCGLFLIALARQYDAQKAATARPASVPSEKQHQATLAHLESRQQALDQSLQSLEQDNLKAEQQLSQVKEQVEEAQSQEPHTTATGIAGDNADL